MTIVKSNVDVIINVIVDVKKLNVNIIENVYRSFELNIAEQLNTANN